jgi:monomeric sarcosine oxidase
MTRVLVVGGGTMGLASAWALAARGADVEVFEQFGHVHDRGSHSGCTRVIRQAYHEGSDYVPIVQEADRLWVELGEAVGVELLVRTGLLEFGPGDHPELVASIDACVKNGVAHETFDADEAMRRWPLALPPDWHACFSPSGGYLRIGPCFDAMRRAAELGGARFHHGAAVREVLRGGDDAGIVLADGTRRVADRVVVTAGAWLPALVPEVAPGALARLRRVLLWLAPSDPSALRSLPVWAAFDPDGFFYGFPFGADALGGLKVARHMTSTPSPDDLPIDPDRVDRQLHERDVAPVRDFVDRRLPAGSGPVAEHRVCVYTVTPSWNFVIDRLPEDPRVVIAGGFSGHGFKFAPAIGRMVAALALDRDAIARSDFAIATLRLCARET